MISVKSNDSVRNLASIFFEVVVDIVEMRRWIRIYDAYIAIPPITRAKTNCASKIQLT